MRNSKRTKILDAIVKIIERDGLTALTFDAVSAETGITRGGLLYHFPSRDDLILAAHQFMAQRWETSLVKFAQLGGDPSSIQARNAAYVFTSSNSVKRAQLIMMLEGVGDPVIHENWQKVIDYWAPPVPDIEDAEAISRFIARLASDGLWIFETLSLQPLPPNLKQRICETLSKSIIDIQ
jgi:AcrR family transcriptional regulator